MPHLAVIFDVDGVLVDSYQAHLQSWQQMLSEQDVQFTEDQFRATFGRTSGDILKELRGSSTSASELQAFDDRKEALYREIIRENFPAIDGARELIDSLAAAGIALAVGSSGPPENIKLTLDCLGCSEKFAVQVTRVDVTRGKPDPQVFQIAGQRLGVQPALCCVVEDAPAGIEAANQAEMISIGLTGTATRKELDHADLVIDSLRELTPEVVTRLLTKII
ncbi:MAG: haloacid dehalogenase [Planctomycetaceae bacterium]|nr:haloacid dehalogenase [Planctomycetaceae bacterium]MCH2596466.1 HAD family phosphatase [Pirellulales bacterium]HCK41519.1 haloacid dehalogenase [Planctomycetaceae bacterium]|tara:strand:- start:183 stop:845 length:663 start_codon:yes stop_codon:yes gene_type:complete